MTLDELNAHLYIVRDLASARDILRTLEATALRCSRLDALPHAPGNGDQTAALAIKIAEQKDTVRLYERMAQASSAAVKAFVDSIQDNRLNVVMYLRFICGYEWQEVAEIIGGKNTEAAVKSLVYRFFHTQAR